jgi:uncharacterized membrane protein
LVIDLRSAGIIPLHNEDAIFATEAVNRTRVSLDWIAGLTAFKAVLLEGLEVVFIVIAVGAGRGLLWPASLGALAACVVVLAIGIAVRRPLAKVPENTLKFAVGTMLSAFGGVFWTGEGLVTVTSAGWRARGKLGCHAAAAAAFHSAVASARKVRSVDREIRWR